MNNLRYRYLLVLLLFSPVISGQYVKISGSGNGYAGKELKVFTLTDPITKSHKPFARIICDDRGSFSFSVPVQGTGTVFIRAGVYTWYLSSVEGMEYQLRLADFMPRPYGEEQNPFFEEVRMIPEILNDTSDINNLIRKFDAEYDPAFNRIADRVAYNVKRGEIPSIIEKLNILSGSGMPPFFTDFVKFRMIMINMVGSGEYSGRVEDSVLINSKFVPENPAFTDLIEQRFSGYFASVLNGPCRNDFVGAVANSSLIDLKKAIIRDGKVSNEQLVEYILLLNLYPAMFDGSIPAENIISLVTSMKSEGSTAYIKGLAGTILERMTVLSQGSKAPDFSLADQAGNEKTITGFAGRFLLLGFTSSDNAAAMAEYGILNSWYKRYSSNLQVVTILTDKNFSSASARMKNAGFGWTMLDGSSGYMVEYMYNVKMYPAFTLIGPDGRIVLANCPYPSENLEKILDAKLTAK